MDEHKIEAIFFKPITRTNMSPIPFQQMPPIPFQLAQFFCLFLFSSVLAKIITAFMKASRPRPIYRSREPIQISSIEDAVLYVLRHNDIQHRLELQEWCGGKSREPLYNEVRKIVPLRWQMAPDPKKYVREVYQAVLPGYTNARVM
jgi:hypothetical protein